MTSRVERDTVEPGVRRYGRGRDPRLSRPSRPATLLRVSGVGGADGREEDAGSMGMTGRDGLFGIASRGFAAVANPGAAGCGFSTRWACGFAVFGECGMRPSCPARERGGERLEPLVSSSPFDGVTTAPLPASMKWTLPEVVGWPSRAQEKTGSGSIYIVSLQPDFQGVRALDPPRPRALTP